MKQCFHCELDIPDGVELTISYNNQTRSLCCIGCQAVAQGILDAGLTDYYKFRQAPSQNPDSLTQATQLLDKYDIEKVQNQFVLKDGDRLEATLHIEGITCSACAWLIEKSVARMPHVEGITVNATTNRAQVAWRSATKLSTILHTIAKLGYQATPFNESVDEQQQKKSRQTFLTRLGLAGFATMQVMMFALALYSDWFTDLESQFEEYFRWVSLIFATPVILYSAQPFYFSALRAISNGRVNMDVPVSIALLFAFGASVMATLTGKGEVYFESVSMFTFFLLIGRFLEHSAKLKAMQHSNNLQKLTPLSATRIENGQAVAIAAEEIQINDTLVVAPGETIAADATLTDGQSEVNESMLTGESLPIKKSIGDSVFAGTINMAQPITVTVTQAQQSTLLAQILRLQHEASTARPELAQMADRISKVFVPTILTLSVLTYIIWYFISPDDAFWIMLSVLVASCPCALSLAAPTAVTAGIARLGQLGFISKCNDLFERIASVNHLIFDKTGTLTTGAFTLSGVTLHHKDATEANVLAIAAALERGSNHPISQAFRQYDDGAHNPTTTLVAGKGLQGEIDGKLWRIGNADFVAQQLEEQAGTLWLSADGQLQASFEVSDTLKVDAVPAISTLSQQGYQLTIASGDSVDNVRSVANTLHVANHHGALNPFDKLALLKELGKQHRVAMIGDGINDAPILSQAHLSIAMGSGADLIKSNADVIFLGQQLMPLHQAFSCGKRTLTIMKQNLYWAFGYNLLIIPLAMMAMVPPYIAALGMSLSSIVVMSNSLRILRS